MSPLLLLRAFLDAVKSVTDFSIALFRASLNWNSLNGSSEKAKPFLAPLPAFNRRRLESVLTGKFGSLSSCSSEIRRSNCRAVLVYSVVLK